MKTRDGARNSRYLPPSARYPNTPRLIASRCGWTRCNCIGRGNGAPAGLPAGCTSNSGLITSGEHACRIVEKAPVGDTSCRHWWFTACSIPAGVEKVIRALCHLRDTHPRKRKLSTELAYFRRQRHPMRDLLVSKGEAGDPRAVVLTVIEGEHAAGGPQR